MSACVLCLSRRNSGIFALNVCFTRSKHKDTHWSVIAKRKSPKYKALRYFDDFYQGFYGKAWSSMRLALLSPSKYCALVNNFGDTEETVSSLKELGAVDIKEVFDAEVRLGNFSDSQDERHKHSRKTHKASKNKSNVYSIDNNQNEEGVTENESAETNVGGDQNIKSNIIHHPASLKYQLMNSKLEHDRILKPNTLGGTISAADLNEFVPATEIKGLEDWVLESEHYQYYEGKENFPINIEKEYALTYPDQWKVLSFVRGFVSRFPSPRRGKAGVFNYYLLDGASVLPVLALNISLGDRVLDMCAAPGGKSLLILQTLYPEYVVSNDVKQSRLDRMNGILYDHIFNLKCWKNPVKLTNRDGRDINEKNVFNKILVDVPCTTDKHSLSEDDNNIFSPNRIKERIKLPEIQAALLSNALKIVCPGGTVVYSTCSLSPIQNDGVVHMALKNIWEETDIEVEIRDLSPALKITQNVFKFSKNRKVRYGHVVVPFLPNNFGPSYFCKLVRTK